MLPWLFIRLFIHTSAPCPFQQRFKSGLYVFTSINNRCPSEHSRAPACNLPTPGIQVNKALPARAAPHGPALGESPWALTLSQEVLAPSWALL